MIPIVYYLFERNSPKGFADASAFAADRRAIQLWLNTVLLKKTFGAVPDNVLRAIRDVIRAHHDSFPRQAITDALESTPHAISFTMGEVEALLDQQYGGIYSFALLALLYPALDYKNKFHQDHLHPKSHFTPAQLKQRAISEERQAQYAERANRIANLQLLEGQPNIEKSATPFAEWIREEYPDAERQRSYRERNFVPETNWDFEHFLEFYVERHKQMLLTLLQVLGYEGSVSNLTAEEAEPNAEVAAFNQEVASRVGRHLELQLQRDTQACYSSRDGDVHVVCVVSKHYSRRGAQFWYAIHPQHVDYLTSANRSFVAFGCGGPELVVLIPGEELVAALVGTRQTSREEGRSYWHVDLFGNATHLELGQGLLDTRIDLTPFIIGE